VHYCRGVREGVRQVRRLQARVRRNKLHHRHACRYPDAGIGPGDALIVTPNTFIATSLVIVKEGATRVYADIDPAGIEKKTTRRTKAMVTGIKRASEKVRAGVLKQLKKDGKERAGRGRPRQGAPSQWQDWTVEKVERRFTHLPLCKLSKDGLRYLSGSHLAWSSFRPPNSFHHR